MPLEATSLEFASTIGTPVEPPNLNRRFKRLRDQAELGWLRLHDLRHAFATFLLSEGVEARTDMDLLGTSGTGPKGSVGANVQVHELWRRGDSNP